jgi:glycosyltransferase involved in cell wall biosynthesis
MLSFGGVNTFIHTLFMHISKKHNIYDLSLDKNPRYEIVKRVGIRYRIHQKLLTILDLIFFAPSRHKINVVMLSPSLHYTALLREIIYSIKCIKANIPYVVFFHGWNVKLERIISNCKLLQMCMVKTLGKSEIIWVLCSDFKKILLNWGFDNDRIVLETTMVDHKMLKDFSIEEKVNNWDNSQDINILFLSRMIKEKGVYIAIDTIEILNKKYPNLKFILAGDGPELPAIKALIRKKKIANIETPGFVSGKDKSDLLKKSHIFFFPTYHNEGMPISVLEAMAFGMPIVTRKVGGLKDFFKNNLMGYITESLNPSVFAELINHIVPNQEHAINISKYNYAYSKKWFFDYNVSQRIQQHLEKIVKIT